MMHIRWLGTKTYTEVWTKMKEFTTHRSLQNADELWLLEHFPVYTQGQAGKACHILQDSNIPIVQSDRGGQITYHGPGQLVAYVLMDIQRQALGIKTFVCKLETVLIRLLDHYDIKANTKCGAPGVYVHDKKIASIGLRVKNGCTYHGIALNVNMNLSPFSNINPCGFADMKMTQMAEFDSSIEIENVSHRFIDAFLAEFNLKKSTTRGDAFVH